MAALVIDTSSWIEWFEARGPDAIGRALGEDRVILPPVVAAELASGTLTAAKRSRLVQLLRVLSVSGLLIATALTYTGGLQGTGDTKSPLYISIVSQIIVPLSICFVISRTIGLQPIHIWLAILVGHATRCALSVFRFNQGRWKGIVVDLAR